MERVELKTDIAEIRNMLTRHAKYTGSVKAKKLLTNFDEELKKFKKIIPEDYKKVMAVSAQYEELGMSREDAQVEAFYAVTGGK